MPKEDCKYWDKCYQKNEAHLEKFNHPKKDATKEMEKNSPKKESAAPKRRSSEMEKPEDDKQVSDEKPKYDTEDLRKEAMANVSSKNWMALLQKRIKFSEQQEYDNLLKTNEFLRHKFLVEMPPDFYAFWKFLEYLKPDVKGEDLLDRVEKDYQLVLVGPFEFLAGRFNKAKIHEPGDYLRHWRFYYDPPEFQTIFVRKGTGLHYGYWRDDPHDKDALLVARNDASKTCEFEFVAGNVFDAFFQYIHKDLPATPFTTTAMANVKKAACEFIKQNEVKYDFMEKLKKERHPGIVCKTFHRAGIVVPFDPVKQIGYRPLIESDAEIKKILKLFDTAGSSPDDTDDTVKTAVMEKLQPIITAASIAVDECDFGTIFELGIDLFCSGYPQLHTLVNSLLVQAYSLLHRPQYIAIIKAHLENRMKSINLSIFEYDK